jgi:hypothetical protein
MFILVYEQISIPIETDMCITYIYLFSCVFSWWTKFSEVKSQLVQVLTQVQN